MSGAEEKSFAPTVRKLRDARKRGEFARGKELVTAVVTATGFATLLLLGPRTVGRFADILRTFDWSQDLSWDGWGRTAATQLAWAGLELVLPMLLLLIVAATCTSIIANGGFTVSATPVVPKLERLDPIKGFGRLFKLRGLVELLKGFVKLLVVGVIATIVLRRELAILAQVPACGTDCVPGVVYDALVRLAANCCIAFLLLGMLDVGLQQWLFRRDMRMTRTEHKRDRKDTDGNPELLARRRRDRQEIAKLGSRTGIKHATFVVQTPDAVLAFRYAPPDATVPVLVARAGRANAATLAAEARRYDVPVVFDPEAVAILTKGLEVGRMVPRTGFAAIIGCMRAAGVIG